jgi:hypothetical protein
VYIYTNDGNFNQRLLVALIAHARFERPLDHTMSPTAAALPGAITPGIPARLYPYLTALFPSESPTIARSSFFSK